MSAALPPQVVRLDFEVFCDGFTEGFPVRLFFLDAQNSEYFVDRNGMPAYPTDVDPDLLDIPLVYPTTFESEFAAADPDFDYMSAAGEALIPWFAKCWREAGGAAFDREATIGLHDDQRRFDLQRGEWTAA